MALQWLLHSACHVLGYPNEENGVVAEAKHRQIDIVVGYPKVESSAGFEMPLHYPRYTKEDYEKMEEWKVDLLLQQYGLRFKGTLEDKRAFAKGTFLWPHQR